MNKGIAVAGTLLVDKLCEIEAYPNAGELTKICSIQKSVGGCVPNVCLDLKAIDSKLNVFAVGTVGGDEDGDFLRNSLSKEGVVVDRLKFYNDKTSFTDVMSVKGGERTFFTYAGASAFFGVDDIDFDSLNVDMLHLGYLLLLKKVDEGDGLKILKKAKEKGIITSIDMVSENSDRYSLVAPCLKYTDNLIVNEIEAGKLAGILPEKKNIREIAVKLKKMGVKDRVIIHLPDLGVCLSDGGYTEIPSFNLPDGFIKGTTGAGDAFCAGALYGIYNGYTDKKIIEFASMTAVASLRAFDAVSGLVDAKNIVILCKDFKRRK